MSPSSIFKKILAAVTAPIKEDVGIVKGLQVAQPDPMVTKFDDLLDEREKAQQQI